MKIIDFHSHIYPEKIASKAISAIGQFYGLAMDGDGTSQALIESGESIGVTHYIVHSAATKPEQVRAVNDFIIRECEARKTLFSGFGTLHPEMADPDAEVDYVMSAGLIGLKLHPDFQGFAADSKKAFRMYEAASGRLPILFHAGDGRYRFSHPRQIAEVHRNFPELTIIAAHFGGYSEWEEAEKELYGLPILFDTSSSLAFLDPADAARRIRKAGVEKFMFGCDFPMWKHNEEFKRFMALPLTDSEKEAILHGNAERVFRGI